MGVGVRSFGGKVDRFVKQFRDQPLVVLRPPEAIKWFLEAANGGYARAQHRLGDLYREGVVGVPKDDIQAYKWYNLAAAQGDDQAAIARKRLGREMTPDQIAQAQKLSVQFRPRN